MQQGVGSAKALAGVATIRYCRFLQSPALIKTCTSLRWARSIHLLVIAVACSVLQVSRMREEPCAPDLRKHAGAIGAGRCSVT